MSFPFRLFSALFLPKKRRGVNIREKSRGLILSLSPLCHEGHKLQDCDGRFNRTIGEKNPATPVKLYLQPPTVCHDPWQRHSRVLPACRQAGREMALQRVDCFLIGTTACETSSSPDAFDEPKLGPVCNSGSDHAKIGAPFASS